LEVGPVRALPGGLPQQDPHPRRHAVRFIAVTQSLDTDIKNPAFRFLLHVLGAAAEFERALISEQTQAGRVGNGVYSRSGRTLPPHGWAGCSNTIATPHEYFDHTGIRLGQIQTQGFYWAGFLSMVLAVLKQTIEGHWSWWRVLLPVWVVLGHNAVYITVAFVWLSFTDDGTMDEEEVARRDDRLYGYQLAAMLCFLIIADFMVEGMESNGITLRSFPYL
jgi:Resolvase, N terminal domain